MNVKICRTCKLEKPLDQFNKNAQRIDGRAADCRMCSSAKLTQWRRENRKKQQRSGLASNASLSRIRNKYHITNEDYEMMKFKQNNRCWICKGEKPLVVDHDHATGKIRGLLCQPCNAGLGMFQDDPERLKTAIYYLGSSLTLTS